MAPRAPWSRDRTVPTGMPSTSAISSCVIPSVVLQDEDGTLLGRESREPALQLIPIVDRWIRVGVGGAIGQRSRRSLPAATAMLGVRGVHEQPVRPGVEPIRVAERRQMAPDVDQRLLRRVLGARPVPQDAVGDRVEPIHDLGDDEIECSPVALLRPSHEIRLHVPASVAVPKWVRLPCMSPRPRKSIGIG